DGRLLPCPASSQPDAATCGPSRTALPGRRRSARRRLPRFRPGFLARALPGSCARGAAGIAALSARPAGLAFDRRSVRTPGPSAKKWKVESLMVHAVHDEPVLHMGTPVPNGKLAMWIFLATEIMFFTGLIGTYIVLRNGTPTAREPWPIPEQVHLIEWVGALN